MTNDSTDMTPKDWDDLYAILLIAIFGISLTVTIFAVKSGSNSSLWIALGALGTVFQAILVGVGVLVALRQLRSYYRISDLERSNAVGDQVNHIAFGLINLEVSVFIRCSEKLATTVNLAFDQMHRGSPTLGTADGDPISVSYSNTRSEAEHSLLRLRSHSQALASHCASHSSFRSTYILANVLWDVCARTALPPSVLALCTRRHSDQLTFSTAEIRDSWQRVARSISPDAYTDDHDGAGRPETVFAADGNETPS